ncbi:LLM class flavin-dependent oxidoreductase [Radiobacillus kanasensis]|uniref:LLM class flavin-dependent oxidoreductase n=1 Tax=Radiobacillus kanasensis TaxID=2844358 RepID=UPI001E446BC2|nr:LLM class flavin-dependent oxidoreductase [Radiobacillus kanasensis]UFT99109.1 LLM class flavin-dependent oxidoreductase [Radiobacillus kanasensis]
MIQLSVLDQSTISKGSRATEALSQTVRLAQEAERLGYHRFWMSEHHLESLAHSSPEIMIPHVAAHTSTIRIGSGGVMLPHYSAYKVAENFRLLEALYPNRIDLGIGRAPGGIPIATGALQEYKHTNGDIFPQQVEDLIYYVTGSKDPNHRFPGLKAMPEITTNPQLWVLGSSGGSAGLAASHGLSYAFAQFISGQDGSGVVQNYQKRFYGSALQPGPKSLVAFFFVCADTDEEAEWLAKSYDIQFLKVAKGERMEGIVSPEEAAKYRLSGFDQQLIEENRRKILIGSPRTIKEQILAWKERYGSSEFMLASMVYDFEAKLKGYQLLSEEFGLNS